MTYHPITPPPELVEQWLAHAPNPLDRLGHVATQAARWGADQELEACCEWVRDSDGYDAALGLRADRRQEPPSLAEQAMQAMHRVDVIWATDEFGKETMDDINAIRRALERLQELEGANG